MSTRQWVEPLVDRYFDETLSPGEERELAAWLEADAGRVSAFARRMHFEGMLRQLVAESASTSDALAESDPPGFSWAGASPWQQILAIAAAVVLAVVAIWFVVNGRAMRDDAGQITVVSVAGNFFTGEFSPLAPGDTARLGSPLRATEGEAAIRLADGSLVTLLDGAEVVPTTADGSGSGLILRFGRIRADVQPRSGNPLQIDADLARCTVIGTRFELNRDLHHVFLKVAEGIVSMHGRNEGELLVGEGEQAVCRQGGTPFLVRANAPILLGLSLWTKGGLRPEPGFEAMPERAEVDLAMVRDAGNVLRVTALAGSGDGQVRLRLTDPDGWSRTSIEMRELGVKTILGSPQAIFGPWPMLSGEYRLELVDGGGTANPGSCLVMRLADPVGEGSYLHIACDQNATAMLKVMYKMPYRDAVNPLAEGHNCLRFLARSFMPEPDWRRLQVVVQDADFAQASAVIGEHAQIGADWTPVEIPLSAFRGTVDWSRIQLIILPLAVRSADRPAPFAAGIDEIAFSGGASPLLWYGDRRRFNPLEPVRLVCHEGHDGDWPTIPDKGEVTP
jgi:ferric-dicitrate binding protein FerR (iron transport regulator)